MNRSMLVCCLLGTGLSIAADGNHDNAPNAPTNAGFEKMKKLIGTWVATDENGKATNQVASVIKLTAGGSTIHETLFPGQPHEMVSLYTVDGADIVMTHCCMLGNQPQMRAKASLPGNQLKFEFVGGTNLNPAKDKHMHSAVLTFVDDDRFDVEGIGWEDGKPAKDMCNGMKLLREKLEWSVR